MKFKIFLLFIGFLSTQAHAQMITAPSWGNNNQTISFAKLALESKVAGKVQEKEIYKTSSIYMTDLHTDEPSITIDIPDYYYFVSEKFQSVNYKEGFDEKSISYTFTTKDKMALIRFDLNERNDIVMAIVIATDIDVAKQKSKISKSFVLLEKKDR